MAQPTYKPLTLSIAPQTVAPTFNYNPVVPTYNPLNIPPGMTLEEKERARLEKQRIVKARYHNKVKEYSKLGSLDSPEEKFTKLCILCYPDLQNVSKLELERKVGVFIGELNSLLRP